MVLTVAYTRSWQDFGSFFSWFFFLGKVLNNDIDVQTIHAKHLLNDNICLEDHIKVLICNLLTTQMLCTLVISIGFFLFFYPLYWVPPITNKNRYRKPIIQIMSQYTNNSNITYMFNLWSNQRIGNIRCNR